MTTTKLKIKRKFDNVQEILLGNVSRSKFALGEFVKQVKQLYDQMHNSKEPTISGFVEELMSYGLDLNSFRLVKLPQMTENMLLNSYKYDTSKYFYYITLPRANGKFMCIARVSILTDYSGKTKLTFIKEKPSTTWSCRFNSQKEIGTYLRQGKLFLLVSTKKLEKQISYRYSDISPREEKIKQKLKDNKLDRVNVNWSETDNVIRDTRNNYASYDDRKFTKSIYIIRTSNSNRVKIYPSDFVYPDRDMIEIDNTFIDKSGYMRYLYAEQLNNRLKEYKADKVKTLFENKDTGLAIQDKIQNMLLQVAEHVDFTKMNSYEYSNTLLRMLSAISDFVLDTHTLSEKLKLGNLSIESYNNFKSSDKKVQNYINTKVEKLSNISS